MVTNYYNASNNFSAPVRREPKPFRPPCSCEKNAVLEKEETEIVCEEKSLDSDTILILGLIMLLILSGCNDTLLLIALGALIFL